MLMCCIALLSCCTKSPGLPSLSALRTAALPLCAVFICMCFNSLLKKTSVGGPQHMVCWGCRCARVPTRLLNLLLSTRLPWSTRFLRMIMMGQFHLRKPNWSFCMAMRNLLYWILQLVWLPLCQVYRGCTLCPSGDCILNSNSQFEINWQNRMWKCNLKGTYYAKIHFYMVFGHKCVMAVCEHNHPTMIKNPPTPHFFIPIKPSQSH